jgi:adenine deaminase
LAVRDVETMTDLMRTAVGRQSPDLIVTGGRVVNVFTEEIAERDVVVRHGVIAAVLEPGAAQPGGQTVVVEAEGRYVTPGLIDAHFHIGGSHLDPLTLADTLLARGTTALATDFYEAYTSAGPDGVRYGIDVMQEAGLTVLFLPPAHLLGLQGVGSFGWDVSTDDMIAMLHWEEAVGIMEPPATAVLAEQQDLLRIAAEAHRLRKVFAGHAPSEVGRGLHAYVATGASSDHESRTADEAAAKLRLGMRAMMREGSASPDLRPLLELIDRYPRSTRYLMLCSDETDPGDLVRKGHMDTKIRLCVEAGVDPVVAIQMATVNIAEYYGISDRLGAIAPGRGADLLLVDDLTDFRPACVIAGGRVVQSDQRTVSDAVRPPRLVSTVNVPKALTAADFRIDAGGRAGTARVRVIGVHDGTLVSTEEVRDLHVVDGSVEARPEDDVLKIAVVERHHASGRIGRGFVEGFGFRSGAVAMTYCHVYHNLLVIGTDDEQMALAANEVAAMGGGMSVVADGITSANWPLSIAGVLDGRDLKHAEQGFTEVNEHLRQLGCALSSPILSLSFIALPTIPAFGLTDRGLYDVHAQKFVPLLVE